MTSSTTPVGGLGSLTPTGSSGSSAPTTASTRPELPGVVRSVWRWVRGRRPSARARILGWSILLMALALALSTVATRVALAERLHQRVAADLGHEAQEFQSVLDTQLGAPRPPSASVAGVLRAATHRAVPEQDVAFVGVLDGAVVTDTGGDAARSLSSNPSLVARWDTARVTTLEDGTSAYGATSAVIVPFSVAGDPHRGTFVALMFTAGESEDLARLTALQSEIGTGALVVAAGLAWLVAGRVLRPVRETTELARRISDSDVSERLPVQGHDEVSELATTFNRMLDRLQVSIQAQKALLADVGHELRTPITIVQGNLDTLTPGDADDAETLVIAADELHRMNRMVDDLVTLAGSEQPDFLVAHTVDVAELGHQLAAKLRALGPRRWDVRLDATGVARLDRQRITQAVMELGANAVSHSRSPGTTDVGGSPLEFVTETCEGALVLTVADDGPGVPAESRNRVFERFARLERPRTSGSGLGLSIVLSITRAHGGRVLLDERPGGGARFRVVIPLGPEAV